MRGPLSGKSDAASTGHIAQRFHFLRATADLAMWSFIVTTLASSHTKCANLIRSFIIGSWLTEEVLFNSPMAGHSGR